MSRNGEHTDCHIPHPAELLYCARPPPFPPLSYLTTILTFVNVSELLPKFKI